MTDFTFTARDIADLQATLAEVHPSYRVEKLSDSLVRITADPTRAEVLDNADTLSLAINITECYAGNVIAATR